MKNKVRLHYFLIGILVALFISICACFAIISTGYVDTRRLIIYSGSAEKAFDDSPLMSSDYGIKNGTLKEGHTLIVETYGQQSEVGASFNSFHYAIVDQTGNSVADQYRVIEAPGLLIVHEEGWIDWEKFDVEKFIDKFGNIDFENSGLDLSGLDLEELFEKIDWENLSDEDKEMIKQAIAAKILESMMGEADTDGDGIPDSMDPDADGNGTPDNEEGQGEGTGTSAAGEQRFDNNLQTEGNGYGENPDQEIMRFYSESGGDYYLRYESFGDYNGSGFEKAEEYTSSTVSPMYYAGTALKDAGADMERVYVENLDGSKAYFLPYYAITGITDETGDIRFSKSSELYSTKVTSYDYLDDNNSYTLSNEFSSIESKYRNYVYRNYTNISPSLKQSLLNMTGFNSSGKDLVRDIKEYVQKSASYNLDFERFPDGVDMVLYFLETGKEGICQHFAAAATMLYRAYGIPARYTCGYKVNAVAGDWTIVTAQYAHAWVEIYVDGFGWVQIEVTGSMFDEAMKNVISITTPTLSEYYGTSLDYEDVVKWEVVSGTLKAGHQLVADLPSESEIDLPVFVDTYENDGYGYKIIDENGDDVTDEYEIKSVSYGTITINKRPITIYAAGYIEGSDEIRLKTEYTGTAQSFDDIYKIGDDSNNESLADGDYIEVLTSTEATEIGEYLNEQTYKITNSAGDDVTEQYEITAKPGRFEITKIKLCVVTADYEHQYDGTKAIFEEYSVEGNYLADRHYHQADKESTEESVLEIGDEVYNKFTVRFYDKLSDEDITDTYYDVTYIYGKLKVVAKSITLQTANGDKEYDGTPLTAESFEIVSGDLLGNDKLIPSSYTQAVEMGETANVMTYIIVDENDDDVSYRYSVSGCWGTLTIYASSITITTGDKKATYSGKPIYNFEDDKITSGKLADGHELLFVKGASIVDVGTCRNENIYKVINSATKEDVTKYYKINYDYGTLTVTPIVIEITTPSESKVYDGEPLSAIPDLTGYKLLDGHVLETVFVTEETEIGTYPNRISFKITDTESGEDVTYKYYSLSIKYGTLTITDEDGSGSGEDGSGTGGSGTGGSGSGEDGSGSGGSGTGGSGSGEDGSGTGGSGSGGSVSGSLAGNSEDIMDNFNKLIFTLNVTAKGKIYLRQYSFGDYSNSKFSAAKEYGSVFSPLYYLGYALENQGYAYNSVTIYMGSGSQINLLPYFVADGSATGDLAVEYDDANYYLLLCYVYDYLKGKDISLPDELVEAELLYRQFVHENYLNIDETLKTQLRDLLGNIEDSNQKEKISNIATFVQNYAKYDLDFEFDTDKDILQQFIETKKGICQHYATMATMLYRACEIPARYVVGYSVDAEVGINSVYGKNAHAWVEVYVDGLGWIPVEVTGTSTAENEDSLPKLQLVISSMGAVKVYDGKPLSFNKFSLVEGKLLDGHKIKTKSFATLTAVGECSNVLEFIVVDENGNDVTYMYEIKPVYGRLKVSEREITIETANKEKVYDGNALTGSLDDINIYLTGDQSKNGLIEGHKIVISKSAFASQTTPGSTSNSFKIGDILIIDENENEVTDYYKIKLIFGVLFVKGA